MSRSLLDILYQDDWLVVVNKPSGLLSVPGRTPDLQDCVVNRLKTLIPDCLEQPSVHRLDMDTSGVLVLALDRETHRQLSIQFQQRRVEKMYEALLDGVIGADYGHIELPFRLDTKNRPYQIYDALAGKWGVTDWRKVSVEGNLTRIHFFPHTGRTHQLRLHAAHGYGLATPIVGDRLYGTGTAPGQLKLHAKRLSFYHPQDNRGMCFEAPVPF